MTVPVPVVSGQPVAPVPLMPVVSGQSVVPVPVPVPVVPGVIPPVPFALPVPGAVPGDTVPEPGCVIVPIPPGAVVRGGISTMVPPAGGSVPSVGPGVGVVVWARAVPVVSARLARVAAVS